MLAVGDGDAAEVFAGRPVLVQVALGEHRHPLGRGEEPEGRVPGEVPGFCGRHRRPVLDASAEAAAGALVERPVADDVVGDAGVDGEDRLLDGAARRASSVMDAREERQLADAEVAGDLDLGVRVGRERDHAVDLGGLEPGVGDRGLARLDREAHLGAAGLLRELGGADADDGGRVPKGVLLAHGASSSVTVPVTWSPRLLEPRRLTSTVLPSFFVTDPDIVMVSPG